MRIIRPFAFLMDAVKLPDFVQRTLRRGVRQMKKHQARDLSKHHPRCPIASEPSRAKIAYRRGGEATIASRVHPQAD
jgi:hypothetical protein